MTDPFRILLSKRVAEDLTSIHAHISKESPHYAAVMIGQILDAIERLKILPHRNVVVGQGAKARHPVRSLPVPPYMVFFRTLDKERVVRILRVRHGAQRRLKRYR
jgi:plasmid stabilization system protein ParE